MLQCQFKPEDRRACWERVAEDEKADALKQPPRLAARVGSGTSLRHRTNKELCVSLEGEPSIRSLPRSTIEDMAAEAVARRENGIGQLF